jgi:hypothetical protein
VQMSCSIIGSFRKHYSLALEAADQFERPTDLPMPIPESAIVDAATLAANPARLLASLVRTSENDRVQALHEDLLAGCFRHEAHARRTG